MRGTVHVLKTMSLVLVAALTTAKITAQAPQAVPVPGFPSVQGTAPAPPPAAVQTAPAPSGAQAATLAEAQAGTYVLRAGDSLALSFRLSPELNQTAIIDPDGSVSLELVGRVQVAGLTVRKAQEVILEKESEHLVRPELNLQLTNFQRFYVVVAGEVYLPQKLEMREELTALQAVLLSGGIKISGRETQVLLYRRVNSEYAEVHRINMRMHKNEDMVNDVKLLPGDLILVPRNKVESVARYVRIVGLSYSFQPQAF